MSPEARQASQAVAGALWQDWLRDVAAARPRAQIAAYANATADRVQAAGGDPARAAQQAGLVDRIGDRVQFGRRVAEIVGAGRDEKVPGNFRGVSLAAWLDDNPPAERRGRIGIVTVSGEIVDTGGSGGSADVVVENIERGLRDDDLAALVVRVDSPGGSVTGSERIRRAILAVRERRIPVIVSFGSVAASGGYWIATAGDQIFAEPSTITGSIGVFGILPSFQGTLQRLGIGADGVRTTPLSGEPDLLRGPSPEVNRLLQMGVESTYRRFVNLVAQARRLSPARVDEIGQGRVWDGGTARQLGLVDRFGSLQDAIAEAGRRANVDPAEVGLAWLEGEPGFWARLLAGMADDDDNGQTGDVYNRLAERPDALVARAIAEAESLLRGPALQARCLECAPALPAAASLRRSESGTLARLLALIGM
jgi:protease-4